LEIVLEEVWMVDQQWRVQRRRRAELEGSLMVEKDLMMEKDLMEVLLKSHLAMIRHQSMEFGGKRKLKKFGRKSRGI
jgi:hypothetical protein